VHIRPKYSATVVFLRQEDKDGTKQINAWTALAQNVGAILPLTEIFEPLAFGTIYKWL